MERTDHDVSAVSDQAVIRKVLLDGLRRTATEVHPFPASKGSLDTPWSDLILVDLEPDGARTDLLRLLRDSTPARAPGSERPGRTDG